MGSGPTWRTPWDDDRAGEYAGRRTPLVAEKSFLAIDNTALTTPPHDSSANTTSLPSFAHAFREASFSPPIAQPSRRASGHTTTKDSIGQPLRAESPSTQKRISWRPPSHSASEQYGSSSSSDFFTRSAHRVNAEGPLMTYPSEHRPQPPESGITSQYPPHHDQHYRTLMDQSRLGGTELPLATPGRQCPRCSNLHSIVHEIISEVSALGELPFPPKHAQEITQHGLPHALRWILNTIRSSSASLREASRSSHQTRGDNQASTPSSPTRGSRYSAHAISEVEKRGAEDYSDEMQRPAKKARGLSSLELSRSTNFSTNTEAERQRSHQSITAPPSSHSPPRAGSSPGSGFAPPPSPPQASSSARMLPSPSSLNFSTALPPLPSLSSPGTPHHTMAHTAHLQDLQRQISIKTLAYQTLQREYDSLIQKLERQRTKCATLEKKFEVSDTEINSLTDEKDRLQIQVSALETQVEELQREREDERREHAAIRMQYMKIVEMASRLEERGAAEERKWTSEKQELEDKIRTLEELGISVRETDEVSNENRTMIAVGKHVSATGISGAPAVSGDARTGSAGRRRTTTPNSGLEERPPTTVVTQPVGLLRAEIVRLSERVRNLESALTAVGASAEALIERVRAVRDQAEGALGE